jgi:hypothetical protein
MRYASARAMPDAPKNLPAVAQRVIDAMLYGVDQVMFPGSKDIPPGTPLSLRHAAIACGIRVRRMEELAMTRLFQDALRCESVVRRESEDPRNLAVALAIRDDPGDGSPSAASARLKAIETIRGKEPVHAVHVTVGQRTRRQHDARMDYQTR